MRSSLFGLAAMATTAMAVPRYILYYDQYHTSDLPDKSLTAGINYVITAFANSSLFASDPAGTYQPFKNLTDIRPLFDNGTKVCMAIGGWGDTAGFGEGAKTPESRRAYAKNIANTVERLGYDCVDVDWEYPGGNGQDYRQIPNSKKVDEIDEFPLVLAEIKAAIGSKELSIAVPGREGDMIAYDAAHCAAINKIVDFVNVMTYDMMNRRDNITAYHVSINATFDTIERYIRRGMDAAKLNIGIPFYAKFFATKPGADCSKGIGCPTELLEDAQGADTGKSGAMTFEKGNFVAAPTNLTSSPNLMCGTGTFYKCGTGQCCSQYGWCGNTTAHCGTGCQSEYGKCEGADVKASFKKALANGKTDVQAGAQWYWDASERLFWTWDTAELISKKISKLKCYGVGGFMAWSLGEDGYDWSHLKAMQRGYETLTGDARSRFRH